MTRRHHALCFGGLLTVLAAWLVGCGSSGPANRYYVLAPPVAEMTAPVAETPTEGVRLGVETFAVDPPYDQPRLVYRVGREAGEVGFYHHHRWAAPPGRLVTTGLVAGLRGLGGIASVEPARVTGAYDAILTGRVLAIEEIDLPGRHIARVSLDVALVDADTTTVLWSDLLVEEVDGQADDAADIMVQMRQAFAAVVVDLRSGVETALAGPRGAHSKQAR